MILGGGQRSHIKEKTLTVLNVLEKKFWMIEVDSIFAEKNKTDYPICQKCRAIFDSSSNTIVGPADDILKLNYMLNAVYVPVINRYAVSLQLFFFFQINRTIRKSVTLQRHRFAGELQKLRQIAKNPFYPERQ